MQSGRPELRPFTAAVGEAALADLSRRLAATRWPAASPDGAWAWGTDLAFMQRLVHHWRERFDWRAWEARLNAHRQHLVTIGGTDVHVLVEPGSGPSPTPIVLTHGWPGSVFELIDLVEPLAHPERFGGSVGDAFTVVLPSLPGFGFSAAPDRVITPREVAAMWRVLMTDSLGFPAFVAHGGDIGATVTSWLGLDHADVTAAIHLNTAVLRADWSLADRLPAPEEAAFIERQTARLQKGQAYQHVHAEKPATIAFALSDSPVGLAAWILEKFHDWTNPADPGPPPFDLDHLIANVAAYWFGTLAPVHWMYQALAEGGDYRAPAGQRVETPTGFCLFPNDIAAPPPRSWLERAYNVAALTIAPDGGHFPGMENSAFLAEDIRRFFHDYRTA